jgi:hypothetical protein
VAHLINQFVREFQKIAGRFQWEDSPKMGLIGYNRKVSPHPFHPLTALYFCSTGKFVRSWQFHEVADELGYDKVSLDIVDACGPRKTEGLADTLRRVALKKQLSEK